MQTMLIDKMNYSYNQIKHRDIQLLPGVSFTASHYIRPVFSSVKHCVTNEACSVVYCSV